jgi:hypothetical protein
MGSSNFGIVDTSAFGPMMPPNIETVRGTDGCTVARDHA